MAHASVAICAVLASASSFAPARATTLEWSTVRELVESRRCRIESSGAGGFAAHNDSQAWTERFDGCGFTVSPDGGGWAWGLELAGFGTAAQLQMGERSVSVTNLQNRLSYEWGPELTEWFVNDHRGLEHGFTLRARPQHSACDAALTLKLAVRGGACAEASADGHDVLFTAPEGSPIVRYQGLAAFDADGVALPARFDISDDSILLTIDDARARYPITIDPVAQQAYLKAFNTDGGDYFGWSVAVSGNTLAVSARNEASAAPGIDGNGADNSAPGAGAVYTFVRSGASWVDDTYFKASNAQESDLFGASIALDGDTLVVGASLEDSNATGVNGNQADNSATDSGAVYVFVRSAGVWSQQAYIKPAFTPVGVWFGSSVSISGDTIVVGAFRESSGTTGVNGDPSDTSKPGSGAAYVFVRNGTTWSQQAYLKPLDTQTGANFGSAVSVSGDTAVIGAPYRNGSGPEEGAAYVFVRNGTTWSQQALVKGANTDSFDHFGSSVALSGDTFVAGAPQESSDAVGVNGDPNNNNSLDSGAAYVFVRLGTTWSQQAYLKASNTGVVDNFGWSVAISGNTVAVGAPNESSDASGINGNQGNDLAYDAGAVYAFTRSGSTWSQLAYIKASNTGANDKFGSALALASNLLLVGAYGEASNAIGVNGDQSNNSQQNAGAAYIFGLATPCPSDIDGNGTVDGADLGVLLGSWGPCLGCPADLNHDGVVNGADLGLLLGGWGICPP